MRRRFLFSVNSEQPPCSSRRPLAIFPISNPNGRGKNSAVRFLPRGVPIPLVNGAIRLVFFFRCVMSVIELRQPAHNCQSLSRNAVTKNLTSKRSPVAFGA